MGIINFGTNGLNGRHKHQLSVYVQIALKSQVAVWLCLLYIKPTVSCFFTHYQGTVVTRAPCQMDRDTSPAVLFWAESLTRVMNCTGCLQVPLVEHAAPLLGAESLTPVTQGTGWLQVVLVEHVSQMANGQGVIQLVHVSPHYVLSYSLHTDYKHAKELIVCTTIHFISKCFL